MSKERSTPVDRRLTAAHERIEELERQVKMLRIAMENAWEDGYCFCGAEGLSDAQKQFQRVFAVTEPKP